MNQFHEERAIYDVDHRWVDAMLLEDLTDQQTWKAKYLVNRKWGNASYLLNPRNTWTEDEYFEYAEKRMRELGIKNP